MTIGILLTNLGTPNASTPKAVRKYLKEFLSDTRVVELPRLLWLPILYGIILPFRGANSAKLYQKIWTPNGSPLRVYMEALTAKLDVVMPRPVHGIQIEMGMRYGSPSLESAMEKLRGVDKLLVLPLYPQYCAATTATTFDKIAEILKSWRAQPELRMINHYFDNSDYINAIAKSIGELKTQKLLFSFHGLPKLFVDKGDPYYQQCLTTAKLITEKLNLKANQWDISFQSRLGKAEWLKPYTDKTLENYPKENIKSVTVICPGFSVDCLETLEEINMQNREIFMAAGGEEFNYVPALNASDAHVELVKKLIGEHVWRKS